MPGRPGEPRSALFFTCMLSHFPMLGVVVFLMRRNFRFEGVVGAFAMTVSLMYHTCECFERSFILPEMRWHRLDNIGAITSVGCSCIQLSCFENRALLDYIQYVVLFSVIILQEIAPWDLIYTVIPVSLCISVPIIAHTINHQRRQRLYLRRLIMGLLAWGVAIICFILGLDDMNDPARIYHGFFHVFSAVGVFFFFYALRLSAPRKRKQLYSQHYEDPAVVVVNLREAKVCNQQE
ncbi:hypothetical protein JKF63_05379 [Porcisia hertigi]|uniref:Uncharacterized protein n=1 Tax=Porcisia hertigi TaxID=2761500 RepID=A0A836ILD1_9TRYP|nr:hypothetical protein JKF63_05379 [Porcisia hertigi]